MDYLILVFSLGSETFGIDVSRVQTILKEPDVVPVHCASLPVDGMFCSKGECIAVVNLARMLGIPANDNVAKEKMVKIDLGEIRIGVLVDRVDEVLWVQQEQLTVGSQDGIVAGEIGRQRKRITLLDFSRGFSAEDVEEIRCLITENADHFQRQTA